MTRIPSGEQLVPLQAGFEEPATNLSLLLETIGTKLFSRERTALQFVAWSVEFGIFELLERRGEATAADVAEGTRLVECGADALLGVLCAVGLLARSEAGRYKLLPAARDYLLPGSPYYIGGHLGAAGLPVPLRYLGKKPSLVGRIHLSILRLIPIFRHGSMGRLYNQHARNLSACVAAVKTGEFRDVRTLVDIGGGSGTLAIPLALQYEQVRVAIADLPSAIRNVRSLIESHGLTERVDLQEFDAFETPWQIPNCDGIFIGNFLHGFSDEVCGQVCRNVFTHIQSGGRVWVHEMLWNEKMEGPLITALWHAAMRGAGEGRQRTRKELERLLKDCGFEDIRFTPTARPFALVSGRKPR